jgi:hypothetical protein
MELSLVHNDPSNTLLIAMSGIQMYQIATPKSPPGSPTTIVRIEGEVSTGILGTEIGRIEHHDSQEGKLRLCLSSSSPGLELSLPCPSKATGPEK